MTDDARAPLRVFITAGEPSGDILGARIMRAMRSVHGGGVAFSGVGGIEMAKEGLPSLFPMSDLSVMGIAEILPRIPLLRRRIRETAATIAARKPDIVVTVDSPDFSFRVMEAVRARVSDGPLAVHCVAPTVWAWRPERAEKVARLYDGLMCLFPFEPPYFTDKGMSAAFTGHPMLESVRTIREGQAFRTALDIPEDAFVLGVLCGSRRGELARTAPVLCEAVRRVLDQAPDAKGVHVVAPTLPHLRPEVAALLKDLPCALHIGTGHKWEAFAAMDAAIAVSGTVALELAVSGVPHVIGYRMKPLTWAIVRKRLKVRHAHLANILLDDEIVPEFIQNRCAPEAMAAELLPLFNHNGAAATAQRTAFSRLADLLRGESGLPPSEQAARYALHLFESRAAK